MTQLSHTTISFFLYLSLFTTTTNPPSPPPTAPNINLVHDPRWGRAPEVMGECPMLTGTLAASYVLGMQNKSSANQLATVACAKHYAVYNTETIPVDRHHFDAIVNSRDLWETYLPAFESLITVGHVQSIMCSYNSVNGIPACANGGLITTIARGTFGFNGFVMSDYDAWAEMVETHHWAANWTVAAAAGLAAGLDQEGGGGPTYPPVQIGIPAGLADGTVTMASLEVAVRRLMAARIRLGMFDPPSMNPWNAITQDAVASPKNLALAELAAREGMVLLKNDNAALPLSLASLSGKKIAIIGPNANGTHILLGPYVDPGCCTAGVPSSLDELSARMSAAGVGLTYAPGCVDANGASSTNCATNAGFAAATAAAASADAVVVFLGMGNVEFSCHGAVDKSDCEAEDHDRTTCVLPGMQPDLVTALRGAVRSGTPLIGVFVHGGALCMEPTIASLDAVLDAFYPGMRGAAAIADALIGVFSPAGRSPISFYQSDASLPADRSNMSPYPNASASSPGITYRYYDEAVGAPRTFTFGEGLSYTTFNASLPVYPSSVGPCDDLPISVTVTNTGKMVSDVVVTLFLALPDATVPAPLTRLASFARAYNVAPGAQVIVTLPSVRPSFRSVVHEASGDDVYKVAGKRWAEKGALNFRITLGEHGGDRVGGLAFSVSQTDTQDISTC